MTTLTVDKIELKHAYLDDFYHYTRERNDECEAGTSIETILLKIMLDNYQQKNEETD
ncbi:MAG: hypothetical protein FWD05_11600 [Oscillospiraceae bacterium]|nr:hypothetical protein [Oscillospiraceae bacterium]